VTAALEIIGALTVGAITAYLTGAVVFVAGAVRSVEAARVMVYPAACAALIAFVATIWALLL